MWDLQAGRRGSAAQELSGPQFYSQRKSEEVEKTSLLILK